MTRVAGLGAADPWAAVGQVRRAGLNLSFAAAGEGQPIVLLPKLGGWLKEFVPLAQRLGTRRRVLAFDLPGHGESDAGASPPYVQTLEESAAAFMAALDELEIKKFDLLGASLGGSVAVVMAAFWPERVNRLVLVGSALTPARSASDVRAEDERTASRLWGPGNIPLLRTFDEVSSRFGVADPSVHADFTASRALAGAWIRPSWRGAALGEVTGRLPFIRAQTLILFGARSSGGRPGPASLDSLSRFQALEIANAGVFAHQDNPKAVAEAVLEFMAPPTRLEAREQPDEL